MRCNYCGYFKGWEQQLEANITTFPIGNYSVLMFERGSATVIYSGTKIIGKLPFHVPDNIDIETFSKYAILL